MTDNLPAAFGLLLGEAVSKLVDDHDASLDKRAAMLRVEQPKMAHESGRLTFEFRMRPNRKPAYFVRLTLGPEIDEDGEMESPLDVALRADVECSCNQFTRSESATPGQGRCSCTLACAWWLHEQVMRRSGDDVLLFLTQLKTDTLSVGREVVQQMLRLTEDAHDSQQDDSSRVQWRIGLSDSPVFGPLQITPYVQRQKKNAKGWTKGRHSTAYELLQLGSSGSAKDARIASLTADSGYDMNREYFNLFQSVELLIGHPNVAWDNETAGPIDVSRGELSVALEPVEIETLDASELPGEYQSDPESEPGNRKTLYRINLRVVGLDLDIAKCELILGNLHPEHPVVLIAETQGSRLVLASLRDRRAKRLISFLLSSDLNEALIDEATAHELTMNISRLGSLIRMELPNQLAGPLESVDAEMIFEMKPRGGAGMYLRLSMFDPRFPQMFRPGEEPAVVPSITEGGPVRLQRDVVAERERGSAVVNQFGLHQLAPEEPWCWVAQSDDEALDILARLHSAGDAAPRIVWPEGESIRVRGEITPSALRVQIDDSKDWFGLSGTIHLDGKAIKLTDLLTAVSERRALVRVGDREFAKISDAFRKRLERLGDTLVTEKERLRVPEAAVPMVQELISTDVTLEAASRWHETIERLESLEDYDPVQPEQLDVELRDYQVDGFRWLSRLSRWGVGGVLADDMGLGKTVQALGVLVERGDDGPALVIAPTSVGDNWVRETERFAPSLTPKLYREAERDQLIASAGPRDIVIVSYQLVQRDVKRFLSR
ncbi:MAG: DEAD/DEAH box helicase, partial [Planctomycetota bacterium]